MLQTADVDAKIIAEDAETVCLHACGSSSCCSAAAATALADAAMAAAEMTAAYGLSCYCAAAAASAADAAMAAETTADANPNTVKPYQNINLPAPGHPVTLLFRAPWGRE